MSTRGNGYRRGAPLYEGTICDEAKGHVDRDVESDAGHSSPESTAV